METKKRAIVKAVSWQLWGLASMGLIAFAQTGSFAGAFTLALTASLVGFVCYFLHERLWSGIRWGLRRQPETIRKLYGS